MQTYEVLFLDIMEGREDTMFVKANDTSDAIDVVERMGEYEVIEVVKEGETL